jgi:hypothetical protein
VKDYLAADPSEKSEEKEKPKAEYAEWLARVKKREKTFADGWWKAAEEAVKLYNNEKSDDKKDTANPYNILYSNTEVLKPSLYSATPKPDVRGRFVENPVSPLTKLVEHFLIVFSDPANSGEESFDQAMDENVTSALVAGMGFIRIRSYPERPVPLCPEAGHYKGLIWPAGRKWSKLPWIAFRHEMRKEEIFSQFSIPEDQRGKYKVTEDAESQDNTSPDEKNPPDVSIVYEVWKKDDKKVCYYCEDWEPILLEEEDDPLKLQGFFPTPGPLVMTKKPGSLIPTPLYQYYRNQAEELNRVTTRLNRILQAIKVRGAYNALLGEDMAKIVSDDDNENTLVAAGESMMLAQNGGFDRQIWLLPIEKLIEVATQLYAARMQIKQVIYEITGLSDIIRGSSVASETATAQNLKNKWGSIRLRDMQKSVANYVRDIYRLVTDAGAKTVPAKKWKAITQAPLPLASEQAAAKERLQQLAMMAQAQMVIGQAQGMQPQPPKPPPPELITAAQGPSIEELLGQIASDANRTFTINVQSDSTVDIDTATDKSDVTEFMGMMGQLLAGLQPLGAMGPTGLALGKEMLVAVCSRFKFGLSIVDAIKALQAPPPAQNGPTPEQEKKGKELEMQEKAVKSEVQKLEDLKRDIETARKEWEADQKIAAAEQAAQKQIMGMQQQVQAAGQKAADAEQNAKFTERKTQLTSATAQLKGQQKATQQVSAETAPVKQGVEALQKAVGDVVSQLQQMAQVVQNLQQGLAEVSKKPKRVRKIGDSFVPEY